MDSQSLPRAHKRPADRFSASGHTGSQTATQSPSALSDAVKRGVLAMYRQGEPNELIAMALGISILDIRSIISAHENETFLANNQDGQSRTVKRVSRKSRHPDRCNGCGAILTIKPCIACTARLVHK